MTDESESSESSNSEMESESDVYGEIDLTPSTDTFDPGEWTEVCENQYLERELRITSDKDIFVCSCKKHLKQYCGWSSRCQNRAISAECLPDLCPVGKYCKNQRFQNREWCSVEIQSAGKKGWGLFAKEDIAKNQFVMEYCGEIIDSAEVTRRLRECYFGSKKFFILSLGATNGKMLLIDATMKGSKARFMNHSCDPNCRTQKWSVRGERRIGFFAIRPIKSGEELTFDYQFERFGSSKHPCYCGSENCRKWLGGKPTSSNQKKQKVHPKHVQDHGPHIIYRRMSDDVMIHRHSRYLHQLKSGSINNGPLDALSLIPPLRQCVVKGMIINSIRRQQSIRNSNHSQTPNDGDSSGNDESPHSNVSMSGVTAFDYVLHGIQSINSNQIESIARNVCTVSMTRENASRQSIMSRLYGECDDEVIVPFTPETIVIPPPEIDTKEMNNITDETKHDPESSTTKKKKKKKSKTEKEKKTKKKGKRKKKTKDKSNKKESKKKKRKSKKDKTTKEKKSKKKKKGKKMESGDSDEKEKELEKETEKEKEERFTLNHDEEQGVDERTAGHGEVRKSHEDDERERAETSIEETSVEARTVIDASRHSGNSDGVTMHLANPCDDSKLVDDEESLECAVPVVVTPIVVTAHDTSSADSLTTPATPTSTPSLASDASSLTPPIITKKEGRKRKREYERHRDSNVDRSRSRKRIRRDSDRESHHFGRHRSSHHEHRRSRDQDERARYRNPQSYHQRYGNRKGDHIRFSFPKYQHERTVSRRGCHRPHSYPHQQPSRNHYRGHEHQHRGFRRQREGEWNGNSNFNFDGSCWLCGGHGHKRSACPSFKKYCSTWKSRNHRRGSPRQNWKGDDRYGNSGGFQFDSYGVRQRRYPMHRR